MRDQLPRMARCRLCGGRPRLKKLRAGAGQFLWVAECGFCRRAVHRGTAASAVEEWNELQRERG